MNEKEQMIVRLAKDRSDPEEFVRMLERFSVPDKQKGDFFLEVGLILYKFCCSSFLLHIWNHSLRYFLKIGDRSGESKCYTNLGIAYGNLGDFRKAIEYLNKSLRIKREIGDRSGESKCYANLGIVRRSLGDFRKAIKYHRKSLKIDEEIGDRSGESDRYTDLGITYANLGNFRKAIEYLDRSLKIAIEIGDRLGESDCYMDFGVVNRSLGDFRKAIEYLDKSLRIKREIGDRSGESKCYANLGIAYFGLGDIREAIKCQKKSLKIKRKVGDRPGESTCYANLGIVHGGLGNFRKAIKYHRKSLKIDEEIGDRSGESKCYANLGIAYGNLGNSKKAIEYLDKSLKIAIEIGDINLERIISLNFCRVRYESEKELAYRHCKHSIELSEIISGRLVEEEKKIMFSSQTLDAYQYMIPLCFGLGKKEEALEYTERSKSRAFLDLLAVTELKPTVELTDELKSLLYQEQIYLNRWGIVQAPHLQQTKTSEEPGETESLRRKLDRIYDQIEEVDPQYVYARRGRPLSFDRVQSILSQQKRNAILVEYFTTDDKTFIFTLSSRDRELHVKIVPLSMNRLYYYTESYWREIIEYFDYADVSQTWIGLSKYLIDPVSEYLTEDALVYFVPYSLIHYLPLHALEFKNEPLIKKHPVAYLPSASLLTFCQNKGSGNLETCASFGVVFEEEAEDIAGLFGTRAISGPSISKDMMVQVCTNKDIIHFSCHGFFDSTDPLSSGIVLGEKATSSPPDRREILTAREIFDMRLNTELVTLSACETGLNKRSPGDELIGLTRAFLYAGAPSVVVSLWSVDARSTHDLMVEFYRNIKKGLDKATALQEAQKTIMEKEEYSHPYYWAPFILVGDWE